MALAKIVVEKRNASGVLQTITPIKIIDSVVARQGSRSVDTGEFTVSIKHDVAENDTIKYIQDVVDTEFLTAIYNFQANDMDEGGYDLDGDDTHTAWKDPQDQTSPFGTVNKHSPNYSALFDGTTGKKITVSHNTKLDFSNRFDIVAWVTSLISASGSATVTDATNKNIFFSKLDNSATGSGIEIGAKFISTNTWAVYAKIKIGSVTTEITGSIPGAEGYYMGSALPRMIRLRRGSDDKIVLTINGSDAGTNNSQVITGDLSNTSNMIIGSNHDDSSPFHGLMHQLRIYNGESLTEKQIQTIHSSPPQPMTMKFLGRVYKIKDSMKEKQVLCKGSGKLLLQTNLSSAILDNVTSATSPASGELASRTENNNIFDTGQTIPNLIQSMIKKVDSEFKFYNNPRIHSLTGRFLAEGNFVKSVNVLTVMDNLTFFTLPRKVFIVERIQGIATEQVSTGGTDSNYVFESATGGGYDISGSGKNDLKTINDVEIIGRLKSVHKVENLNMVGTSPNDVHTALAVSTSYALSENPQNLVLRKNSDDSLYTDYTFDFDSKTITTTSGAATVLVYAEYWYDDISSNTALYKRETNTASIADLGRYSQKIYIPQLDHIADFNSFALRYLGNNNSTTSGEDISGKVLQNERITIKAPFLINSLRENHKIDIVNLKKFATSSNTTGTKLGVVVKSIEWHYPEGKTIIQCGEYDFDTYDYFVDTSDSLSGLTSTLTKTKTA
jgi:hypothetical protein